ncbi:MAG: hypothetical protein JWO47_189 [Candidatus Saccharibacteria bacterium]|nr:hypothetical protein [Candidatus Saccharibacteria bacterium]
MRILRIKKPKKTQPLSQHPREFIEELLNIVIYQLYGIEYSAVVAHPAKTVAAKTAHKIDYVFTSFELANGMDQSPIKVSDEIATQIIRWIEKKKPNSLQDIKLESVNGYVNFELSEKYLSEAAYYVAHWLQRPQDRQKKSKRMRILVEGPVLGEDPETKPVNETFSFVRELYGAAGYSVLSKYLMSDASEDAAKKSAPGLMESNNFRLMPKGHNPVVESAQFERRVRKLLNGQVAAKSDEALAQRILKLQKNYLERCIKELKKSNLNPEDLVAESALTKKVHEWLDTTAKKRDHIIFSTSNQSAYYHIPVGPMASLRTANGSLFRAAYLLYSLDTVLSHESSRHDLLVAIVPKKYHQLLYGHADLLGANISYKTFICIDPEFVYTTLPLRRKSLGALSIASQKIAHGLASALHKNVHNGEARSSLVGLVDFPVELNELASHVRLLEVFALITSSVANAEEFLS